jgi:ATP-binding cassette subfamily B protein/ATP-binding cassette subfamily C protein
LGLLFLSILLSFIETIGDSVIMPFISVASNPDLIETGIYAKFFNYFGFSSKASFVTIFGILIVIFYVFRAAYNIIYTYTLNNFSMGISRHLSLRLFKIYLSIPYKKYVQMN